MRELAPLRIIGYFVASSLLFAGCIQGKETLPDAARSEIPIERGSPWAIHTMRAGFGKLTLIPHEKMDLTFFVAIDGVRPLAKDMAQTLGNGSLVVMAFDSENPEWYFEYAFAGTPHGLVGTGDPSNNKGSLSVQKDSNVILIVSSTVPQIEIAVLDHDPEGIESFPPANDYRWTLGEQRHLDARPPFELSGAGAGTIATSREWRLEAPIPDARAIAIGWTWQTGPQASVVNDTLVLELAPNDRRTVQLESDAVWLGVPHLLFGSLSAFSTSNETVFGRSLQASAVGSDFEAGVIFLSVPLK